MLTYEIRNYIQTSIVSLIFILGGVKLLKKNKNSDTKELDESDEDGEEI